MTSTSTDPRSAGSLKATADAALFLVGGPTCMTEACVVVDGGLLVAH